MDQTAGPVTDDSGSRRGAAMVTGREMTVTEIVKAPGRIPVRTGKRSRRKRRCPAA